MIRKGRWWKKNKEENKRDKKINLNGRRRK
jgi:hypothetical protein